MLSCERECEGDVTVMTLHGVIDEDADLRAIFIGLSGRVRFRMADVTDIDSCGVRGWIRLITPLMEKCTFEFEDVSLVMIKQFNTVMNIRGNGTVRSFKAPYFCEGCHKEVQEVLVLDKETKHLGNPEALSPPPRSCPTCKAPMEFDEIPERYFTFIELQYDA